MSVLSQAEAAGSDSSGVRDSGMEEWMEDEEGVSPPLLCCETEDGVIPHALERLLDSSSCRNPSDCLMLTVHLLLLETGFLPQVTTSADPSHTLRTPAESITLHDIIEQSPTNLN